jgi:hypothetical protein
LRGFAAAAQLSSSSPASLAGWLGEARQLAAVTTSAACAESGGFFAHTANRAAGTPVRTDNRTAPAIRARARSSW